MMSNRNGRRLTQEVWDVVRATSPTHLHLRNRLWTALVVTLLVDAAGSVVMFLAERDAPSTGLHSFGDAVFWTSSQLTTISSSLPNPVTGLGQVVAVLIDAYAIAVVAGMAGAFSAFFHRRGEERNPLHGTDR